MKHLIPRLDPAIHISPQEGAAASYALWHPEKAARVELNAGAVAALLLIDGQRTVEIVEANALQLGVKLPPTFLTQLLGALEGVGLVSFVEASSLAHWVLPETAHVCEGCGRSCEGHLVGPLSREEIARIHGHHEALVEIEPRFEGVKTMVSRGGGEVFLAQVEGRCVFLNPDRRCALHAHFGGEVKPAICRLFPFVRVMTEEGPRLGVHTACFRHHAHAERALGDPVLVEHLEGELAALPGGALDRDLLQLLPMTPTPPEHRARVEAIEAEELRLLTYLGQPSATLPGVLALLEGHDIGSPELGAISPEALKVGVRLLKRFGRRLKPRHTSIGPLMGAEVGLGASYTDLVGKLMGLGVVDGPLSVARREEVHLLDGLRRLLFIRETMTFENTHVAFGALSLGWLLARLASEDDDARSRHDRSCERQAAWFRLISTDGLHEGLFEAEREARLWLKALGAPGPAP